LQYVDQHESGIKLMPAPFNLPKQNYHYQEIDLSVLSAGNSAYIVVDAGNHFTVLSDISGTI